MLIAICLIITETALFGLSLAAGDKPMEFENGFFTYPANMMYFPVAAFAFQIIAALCLIASAIWVC